MMLCKGFGIALRVWVVSQLRKRKMDTMHGAKVEDVFVTEASVPKIKIKRYSLGREYREGWNTPKTRVFKGPDAKKGTMNLPACVPSRVAKVGTVIKEGTGETYFPRFKSLLTSSNPTHMHAAIFCCGAHWVRTPHCRPRRSPLQNSVRKGSCGHSKCAHPRARPRACFPPAIYTAHDLCDAHARMTGNFRTIREGATDAHTDTHWHRCLREHIYKPGRPTKRLCGELWFGVVCLAIFK
jgi:hypothetical protein